MTEINQARDYMAVLEDRVHGLVEEMKKWPEAKGLRLDPYMRELPNLVVRVYDAKTFELLGTIRLTGLKFNNTLTDADVLKSLRSKLSSLMR